LLLDAGIPLKAIQIGSGFKVHQLSGCFITHSHQDHSKAAKDLAHLGVDIYTSRGTMETCKLEGHRFKPVKPLEQLTVGTFQVLPFDVDHDVPEPLGFLFTSQITGEKLLYFTDTYFIRYCFQGLTHILGECNYDRETLWENINSGEVSAEQAIRLFSSHMSLDNFLAFLKANDTRRLRQIYVCHMSDKNGSEEKIRRAIQEQTGAEVYVC